MNEDVFKKKRFGVKTILDIRIFAYDCRAWRWDIFNY